MLCLDGFKDIIRALLIFVHRTADPHVIVCTADSFFCWEGAEGGYSLKCLQTLGELVLDKNTAFWSTEVGPSLFELLSVKGLMNNTNTRTSIDSDSNHTGDVVQVTLCKSLSSVKGIDPDGHLFFFKLIGKFVEVIICLGSSHAVNIFHLQEVIPVPVLLHVVIIKQHFLGYVLGV